MSSGMLFFRLRVVLLTVLVLVGCTVAFAQDNPAGPLPADDGAAMADPVLELWRGMLDAGMIDETQYQHILQHGRLPGGSVVQDSPVDPTRQSVWQGLAAQEIITPEELAHMLFKGAIPNLTEAETKAFEELAPVYEPDRRKRLAYDVRRRHIVVDMIRLKHRSREDWEKSHAEALEWAERTDSPVKGKTPDGSLFELMRMGVHGDPIYHVTLGEHPTGVAGTMAAAGVVASAKGMAYAIEVDAYHWNDYVGDLADMVAGNSNILLSNHSYGEYAGWRPGGLFGLWIYWNGDIALSETEDWRFGYYSGTPRSLDEFCKSAIYHLPVYAAGNDRDDDYGGSPHLNYAYHDTSRGAPGDWFWRQYSSYPIPRDGGDDGFDTMLPHAVAKNVLAVGSVNDLPNGYSNGVSVTLAGYSTFGPTDDGRIKPDLVANGQGVYTTYTTGTNGYSSVSGTSFSTPSVVGSMALLQELHERSFGTEQPMLASTMKALVLHTADDVGEPGPDYKFGWGLMNTENAAWVVTNNASWKSLPHIKEVALNDGDYIEFDVLATTNSALKVTICWTDLPGTIPAYEVNPTNLMLINDLDLRVIAPNGGTNFPWVLDMHNPANAATTGDNYRDNVEQVIINDPTNDWYTIRVTHKGTLSNAVQDVSIIVTGNTPTNAPDFVITDLGPVGTNGLIQLEWPGVVGALYEIEISTNLLVSNGWTNANITLSAPRELMEWTDDESNLYGIRFYRLRRLK